jgi:peptide/nickel transport system permease protein
MFRFIVNRLLIGAAIMAVISLGVFILTNVATDPAIVIAGEGASAADIEAVRQAYGFDRPITERYVSWLSNAVNGDFGNSYRQRRPVAAIIAERLPVTMLLATAALTFSLVISIPLALLAALFPYTIVDRLAVLVALIGQAMPPFWLALLGIVIFAVGLRMFPVSGTGSLMHYVLPAITLSFYSTPAILRLTRAGLIDVLQSDYIRTARAMGHRTSTVILKYALRNAIVPVVAVASVQFGFMLSGSVVVETIFAMQGIGYLAYEAVSSSDIPIIQALVLVTAMFYVALTLFADILNAWIDPRIRVA